MPTDVASKGDLRTQIALTTVPGPKGSGEVKRVSILQGFLARIADAPRSQEARRHLQFVTCTDCRALYLASHLDRYGQSGLSSAPSRMRYK